MATYTKRDADRDDEVAEGAIAFTLTKPVDLEVLDAELVEAMNWRKEAGLVADGDTSQASEDNPVTIWVVHSDVDTSTLRSVVAKHEVPEPSEQRAGSALLNLRAKAEDGVDFTPEETQQVLREFVLRETS